MASSSRQRRVVAAILLPTLGLSGVLVSQGTTQLVASKVLPLDASTLGPQPLGNVRPAPQVDVDPMPILRRNIFDHETGALDEVQTASEVAATETTVEGDVPIEDQIDPNAPPPACEGSMRLVGSFVRMRRPEDSFAAITDASGESLLYMPGMEVDDREIVLIQHNRVILQPQDGRLCSLTMFGEEEHVATAPRPAPAAPQRGTPDGFNPDELEAGISKVSQNEYTIDRGLVNRLLANQAALMRTARVIPHEEDGRVVGVKLYGIRRSSLLGRLGIQNGDMLRTINGYDMTSPDTALEAYARLRSADRITVNLVRRGQDQTVDYQIQ